MLTVNFVHGHEVYLPVHTVLVYGLLYGVTYNLLYNPAGREQTGIMGIRAFYNVLIVLSWKLCIERALCCRCVYVHLI